MDKYSWTDLLKKSNVITVSIIGTITTLIAFATLLRQNPQLFVVVLAVFLFVFALLSLLYIILAKTQAKIIGAFPRYKFHRARPWAIAALCLISFLAIKSLSMKSVQNFTAEAIYGTATPALTSTPTISVSIPTPLVSTITPLPTAVNIKTVLIGKASDYYKIEVTAYNPLSRELLVKHIRIVAEYIDYDIACCCGEVGDYKISKDVIVSAVEDNSIRFVTDVSRETGNLTGYSFPVQGSNTASCGYYHLELDFDTSFLLPKDSYSSFLISIPKQFNVIENNSYGGYIDPKAASLDLSPVGIYFPEYTAQQVASTKSNGTPTATYGYFSGETTSITIEATLDPYEIISFTLH